MSNPYSFILTFDMNTQQVLQLSQAHWAGPDIFYYGPFGFRIQSKIQNFSFDIEYIQPSPTHPYPFSSLYGISSWSFIILQLRILDFVVIHLSLGYLGFQIGAFMFVLVFNLSPIIMLVQKIYINCEWKKRVTSLCLFKFIFRLQSLSP